jgi:alpha-glucosidase (family GH31 glycosyl hydrolase)
MTIRGIATAAVVVSLCACSSSTVSQGSVGGGPSGTASGAPYGGLGGDIRPVVSAVDGGAFSVRFLNPAGGAVTTMPAAGPVRVRVGGSELSSTTVLSHSHSPGIWTVTLGTAAPGVTATVTIRHPAAGRLSIDVAGHGSGINGTAVDLTESKDEHFFGLGERSTTVDQRGQDVQNRVLDGPYTDEQASIVRAFVPPPGFSARHDATYFPMPWMMSTRGYGALLTNDEDSTFDFGKHTPGRTRLSVNSSTMTLRLFGGPHPADTLRLMTATIGRQPAVAAPFILGAWYQPSDDARAAAEVLAQRSAGVPVSLTQTYHHFLPCGGQDDAAEAALTAAVHKVGSAITTYVNPMMCTSHPSYQQGVSDHAFTTTPTGQPITYRYSTASQFMVSQFDFSGSAGRALFDSTLAEVVKDGYDGWMEDFGEYTPDDAVSADGTPGPTMHNRYVDQYHGTAYQFSRQAPRPLARFNRSGWTGAVKSSQIVWGGDASTEWGFDGLRSSITQGLTMGLSGVAVWGPDIGGYFSFEGHSLTAELLNRWIEFGAFTGVMRLQSGEINVAGGPRAKVTDPAVAPVWRRYTQLRTRLYPYIAGSLDAYRRTGMPLMRQLSLVDPNDPRAVATSDEYLFGADLLVAPVVDPGSTSRSVYVPKGRWLDVFRSVQLSSTGSFDLQKAVLLRGQRQVTVPAPIDRIPLLLRAGAVLPMLPTGVQTLSSYGTGLQHLSDVAGRRSLLALPALGRWSGPLGHGESVASVVDRHSWRLTVHASRARTYDVQASFAALPTDLRPSRVQVAGRSVPFHYDTQTRVLKVSAQLARTATLAVSLRPA